MSVAVVDSRSHSSFTADGVSDCAEPSVTATAQHRTTDGRDGEIAGVSYWTADRPLSSPLRPRGIAVVRNSHRIRTSVRLDFDSLENLEIPDVSRENWLVENVSRRCDVGVPFVSADLLSSP